LIRCLRIRKWNRKEKRWETPVSNLEHVMRIFKLSPSDFDDGIRELLNNQKSGELNFVLDPLYVKIKGGAGSLPIELIDKVTSYPVAGYRYSPRYRKGHWDGRRRLLNSGKLSFPRGLWMRVRAALESKGVSAIKVEYQRVQDVPAASLQAGPVRSRLRDYQQEVLDAALEARVGVIQMATGSGKTLLAAHLVRELDQPTCFFVHTCDLLYQAADVIEKELGIEVGKVGDGHASIRPVTVMMIQTCIRSVGGRGKNQPNDQDPIEGLDQTCRIDGANHDEIRELLSRVRVVFFDECHHLPASSFYRIAMVCKSAEYRYGLSATPWRDDGEDLLLEAALGPKISEIKCSDMISRGYLIRPRISMKMIRMVLSDSHGRMDYQDIYRELIVENRDRNCVITTQAEKWAGSGRSVLILVNQVNHGEILLQGLPGAGFIHGSMAGEDRKKALVRLEQKLQPIMIATTLADEGLDIPTLDALILAGGGKSATRAYQRVGRVLRKAPGKSHALILDFMDEGPWLKQHSHARLDLYRAEPQFNVQVE
jgi:superfamily II DNA or RNA helicase